MPALPPPDHHSDLGGGITRELVGHLARWLRYGVPPLLQRLYIRLMDRSSASVAILGGVELCLRGA
jgi:hypothetical protein